MTTLGRYHVDTPAQLALVAIAFDQAVGLRDAAGNPTPRAAIWHGVAGPPIFHVHAGSYTRLVDGGDGTAALWIVTPKNAPGLARVNAFLGTTVGGVALPPAASLLQVTRAREHSRLPTAVRDALDDDYVNNELDGVDAEGNPRDTPAARGRINAELQGARASQALARKDARGSQSALEMAMRAGR